MNSFSNFADLASFIAEERCDMLDAQATFDRAFVESNEMAKMSITAEPEKLDMPDPDQARAAVEMVMQTIFDVFRDTRMESYAQDLVWGFTNSFHVVARRIAGREDDAARELAELARTFDPSEIYATQLEDTQTLCQTMQDCREAMECMRDYAGEVYRIETGKPFSTVRGSKVSNGVTASQIEARDFLAAREKKRNDQFSPDGPIVIFSGGREWSDYERIWNWLDDVLRRIPNMVLVATAQHKGCDAIAAAWAAARNVKIVMFRLNRSLGNRAGFARNDRLVELKASEAVICEGSGIQINLYQKLRKAGVPVRTMNNDAAPAQKKEAAQKEAA